MEKYYFDEIKENKKYEEEDNPEKITLDSLKEKVRDMDIYAEVQSRSSYRAIVVVHKDVGTTMFHSQSPENHFWLQKNSVKQENVGNTIKYHFVLDW